MLRNLTVGKQIGLGFTVVLLLTGTLGIVAYTAVGSLLRFSADATVAHELDTHLVDVEVAHLKWVDEVEELLNDIDVTDLDVQTDDHKCALGAWLYGEDRKDAERRIPSIAPYLKQMEGQHAALHTSAVEIKNRFRVADMSLPATLAEREVDHLVWANNIRDLFATDDGELDVQTDPSQCALGRWLAGPEAVKVANADPELARLLASLAEPHRELHESAAEIRRLWGNGGDDRTVARQLFEDRTLPALNSVREGLRVCRDHVKEAARGLTEAREVYENQTQVALADVQGLLAKVRTAVEEYTVEVDNAMVASGRDTRRAVSIVGFLAFVIGAAGAAFIARAITRALKRVITHLNEGADQVNDAAGQVSVASQQLAEGASEQASSLEESSSALEELTAMTRSNAEHARQASDLSARARAAVSEGDQTMSQLTQAMGAINDSSGEVAKIIKVIEEIAFQTNLLALNAAVEAARAGEHGKGFAVVADEVRSLAQRCAQAAGETTTLIDSAVSQARQGSSVADGVASVLGTISQDVANMNDLMGQIAQGSDEQAQGIEQISTAVGQMEKVTQQNAAGAQESASASEQLSAQAQSVKGMVDELVALVGGNQKANRTQQRATSRAATGHSQRPATRFEPRRFVAGRGTAPPAATTRPASNDQDFLSMDDAGALDEF